MTKEMEQLAIVGVLGVTAFVLWRAYRNGNSLGTLGAKAPSLKTAALDQATSPAQRAQVIRPSADSLIDSIYGSDSNSGSSGGGGTAGGVVLSNGTLYTAGSDPGYSLGV